MERTLTWHSLVLSLIETYGVVAFISVSFELARMLAQGGSGRDLTQVQLELLAQAQLELEQELQGPIVIGWLVVGLVWFGGEALC